MTDAKNAVNKFWNFMPKLLPEAELLFARSASCGGGNFNRARMLYSLLRNSYNIPMKTGVLGGTFDPVHLDHLQLIKGATKALGLQRVILLPTLNPPHKKEPPTPYATRLEMLKIFASECGENVVIDELEREFAPKAYASETLPALVKKYAGDQLYYIIGSDSLRKFTEWKNPEIVASSMPIAVYPRGKDDEIEAETARLNAMYPGARFIPLPYKSNGLSSSDIRFKSETGDTEGVKAALTPNVAAFVIERGLYLGYSGIVDRLRSEQPEGLFRHSLRSAEWAVTHAWLAGTGFSESFLSALLHDSAKPFSPMFPRESYPEGTAPPVYHQYDGAYRAEHDFGIPDKAVRDAIMYHTTARPGMTKLDELVYLADKLEAGRDYPGVEELRKLASEDLSRAVYESLIRTREYLINKGERPDNLTLQAAEWYNRKK